jgi:hypothetical protein
MNNIDLRLIRKIEQYRYNFLFYLYNIYSYDIFTKLASKLETLHIDSFLIFKKV